MVFTMKIDKFEDGYAAFSNFLLHPVILDGVVYPSNEHAYHAAKTLDKALRRTVVFQTKIVNGEKVEVVTTPGQCKRIGRKLPLRPDWEQVKLQVMEDLVRQKFQDPDLKEILLDTGKDELIEGNWWGDTFWGVCNGVGENHLGKILMKVREELQNEGK